MSNQFIGRQAGGMVRAVLISLWCFGAGVCSAQDILPNTQPLQADPTRAAAMAAGIDRWLMQSIEEAAAQRSSNWHRDFSSPAAYESSVRANRERLRRCLGATDPHLPVSELMYRGGTRSPAKVAQADNYEIYAVTWPVFDGVSGEGLWLKQKTGARACVVALPDADQTPEMVAGLAPGVEPDAQFARRLAENGCEVLVPVLVSRQGACSGDTNLGRVPNELNREGIYRQAFKTGRHIIGYEVQKVLAAVSWFKGQSSAKVGLAGYGEGGLIAFYATALDRSVDAVLVSGYFNSRDRLWEEPAYRNVFGLLRECGDAEIASLIAPRALILEHSPAPAITGVREKQKGLAPGIIATPEFDTVEREFDRLREILQPGPNFSKRMRLLTGSEGSLTGPMGEKALTLLIQELGVPIQYLAQPRPAAQDARKDFDPADRQCRQVKELVDFTQKVLSFSERRREEFFCSGKLSTVSEWESHTPKLRQQLWEEVIGKMPQPTSPVNPRSRKVVANANWAAYEVMLDVSPDLLASGYLLLPNNLPAGQRCPVIVCQPGPGEKPEDTWNEELASRGFGVYKAFAAHWAKEGLIVFVSQAPCSSREQACLLSRKASLIGQSLSSVMIAQHSRILDWLSEQPFVDPKKIGFFGLCSGSLRIPAVIDRYAFAIRSGDFADWAGESELAEFNLANTFGPAEIVGLIAPRAFMLECGSSNNMSGERWVAYEYSKVRRLYARFGLPERTAVEFFDRSGLVDGTGIFDFIRRQTK